MELPNPEQLGGLLSQHLQELDESMALLTNRSVSSGTFLREAREAPRAVPPTVAALAPPPLAPLALGAPAPVAQRPAPSLESLLRGIETQQLSVAEALRNLEQSPAAPPPAAVAPEAPAPAPRCESCAVLGLQIRALSQSLAGLSASMVRWSEQLAHSRQKEVVDMVLDYVQPLKQVDARLETLVLELRQDLAAAVLAAPAPEEPREEVLSPLHGF